ncbi:MAG: pyrroline-5-carboxylate reductase [Coriobacteriales bacterium]|nr:pyrroline-5-carboxylate reductase [Coriobacteriales bacterium]
MTDQSDIFEELGVIALIGGGKMGEGIVAGLVQGVMLDPRQIIVADPNEHRREHFIATYGVDCVASGEQIQGVNTCILAIKPQVLKEVASRLAQATTFVPKRVISIAAGVDTQTLSDLFNKEANKIAIVRVMPNTPLLVGAGMSAVAIADGTPVAEGELARSLFALMGEAVLVDEAQMNAITALSGSGPAYFALLAEEMAQAACAMGIAADRAEQLSVQTLIGTARQLQLSGISPTELRQAVTSPGGTTQAALESFADDGFGQIVAKAVKAARRRAEEMA